MKISIITATYNSSTTLRDTIQSVLSQTYTDIEYILIDGGSQDSTLSIIQEYEPLFQGRMKWISEPDCGIYDAMNKGIRMATGDAVGILNSDDFYASPNVLSQIATVFEKEPWLEGLHTNLYYVNQSNPQKIIRHWISSEFKAGSFAKGWHPAHPTLYLRKEVYNKYGLFDLDFKLAADFELMLRLFEKHQIKTRYLNITTIRMRLGGATSKNFSNIKRGNIECIQAFKKNSIPVSKLYPFYRLIPKLLQFFRK